MYLILHELLMNRTGCSVDLCQVSTLIQSLHEVRVCVPHSVFLKVKD